MMPTKSLVSISCIAPKMYIWVANNSTHMKWLLDNAGTFGDLIVLEECGQDVEYRLSVSGLYSFSEVRDYITQQLTSML